MNRKSASELLPVIGAIILFFCWVFQQSMLEDLNAKLINISSAENLYRTYQSHNAVFNAIVATQEGKRAIIDSVRKAQIYNYGLGLQKLATVTGTPEKVGYDFSVEEMQTYLELVQGQAAKLRTTIEVEKAFYGRIFIVVYGLGSILALLGTVLKLGVSPQQNVRHETS